MHRFCLRNCYVKNALAQTGGREWRSRHRQVPGAWWQDWTRWLVRHCGPLQAPPPTESKEYPALWPAPGTYVLEH